jgi:DNA primase
MSLDELKVKIKEEIPISSIIGSYLSIKKSGTTYLSLCPFHSDSKPSMHINDHKKMFKCFACEEAGDSIGFVMKYRNIDFIEALKEICQKQGINFDSYQEEKKSNPKLEMARKILTKTAQLYRKTATTHKFAPYDDFIKKRGLNEEIAAIYHLGFAQSKNSLCDYLGSIPNESDRTFALSIALELGLIKKDLHHSSSHYDTFRDRIIFPIWDQLGQVIGFTSRAIRDDQKAKYMNSVDSFIFNKRTILYGLHLAKNAIRENDAIILVEGNMDQVALYNNGFHHTVAIMGIALGATSVEKILSLTKNIYLALDTDSAGFKAMERINRQFAEKGVVPKYLEFSPQKDPDEFLQVQGALSLQAKIEQASAAFDVLLNKLIPDIVPEVLDRKLEILNSGLELISPLRTHLAAIERVVTFAKRLGLKSDSDQIVKSYEKYLNDIETKEKMAGRFQAKTKKVDELVLERSQGKAQVHDDQFNEAHFALSEDELNQYDTRSNLEISEQDYQNPPPIIPKEILTKAEKHLVQELVQHPTLFSEENSLELLDFVTSNEVKKYIGKVKKLLLEIDETEYTSVISNLTGSSEYSPELRVAVSSALFNYKVRELDSKRRSKIIHDLKIKLQMELLKTEKEKINDQRLSCQSDSEMTKLLQSLSEIEKNLQAFKKTKHFLKNQNTV